MGVRQGRFSRGGGVGIGIGRHGNKVDGVESGMVRPRGPIFNSTPTFFFNVHRICSIGMVA